MLKLRCVCVCVCVCVAQTFSPSMDIGISSNFERYLFYLFDKDHKKLKELMDEFNTTGKMSVNAERLQQAQGDFIAASCNGEKTIEYIEKFKRLHNYILDPHTGTREREREREREGRK